MAIIRNAAGSNGESYVIKPEIEEHSIVALYRSQLAGEEKVNDFGVENRYRHLPSNYAYPEKAEEFNTKVMNEACQGPTTGVAVPFTHAWHSGPDWIETSRKYGDEDDRKKLNDSPIRDRRHKGSSTHPVVGSNRDVFKSSERPRGNEGHNARIRLLGKRTNDIDTAMEYLMKESTKPSYAIGKEKEEFIISTKIINLATTRRRTASDTSGPDIELELKGYDSEEEEEEIQNPDRNQLVNNWGGEKPFKVKVGHENPKRNPTAVQFGQTAGIKKYPETIVRNEASLRYGEFMLTKEIKAVMRKRNFYGDDGVPERRCY